MLHHLAILIKLNGKRIAKKITGVFHNDANGNDTTKEQVEANYRQIKLDVVEIIEREKERIANDPELRHLVEKEGE